MPSAAFETQTSANDSYTTPQLSELSQVADGCYSWLQWMQKLLHADSLVLYRCNMHSGKVALRKLSALPPEKTPGQVLQHLAQRSAESATLAKLNDVGKGAGSTIAIPNVVGVKGSPIQYVLVIERHGDSNLDLQTQVRLVVWAFSVFNKFNLTTRASESAVQLSQWVVERLADDNSGCIYAQLVKRLAERMSSDCCLLAKLDISSGRVSSASLIAVSGQPRVDARLAVSRAFVTNFEHAYLGKQIPLEVLNQPCVEPTLTQQTAVTKALEQCARLNLPVCIDQTWFVVALERTIEQPFCAVQSKKLHDEFAAAMRITQIVQASKLGVRGALVRRFRQWLVIVGSTRVRKACLMITGLFFLWFFFFPIEHRISAPLNVEASERHVLIAPIDGIVESIEVKAGDQIIKGQTLATLDDHELQIQQQKLESESLQNEQSFAKALAGHDRVEVTRLKEQSSQINAELTQIALQRNKMVLVAPTDAVVLSATLDDYLGATISAGETLFSLGSIESHRLVLNVSEYDVQYVQIGQEVGLRLSANPSHILAAEVVAIMPLVVASAGVNTVQVHAKIVEDVSLRPGMQGLGKILVGRQALGVQWLKRAGSRLFWLGWKLGLVR